MARFRVLIAIIFSLHVLLLFSYRFIFILLICYTFVIFICLDKRLWGGASVVLIEMLTFNNEHKLFLKLFVRVVSWNPRSQVCTMNFEPHQLTPILLIASV